MEHNAGKVTMRPYWECPRNLLPHNLIMAYMLPLESDSNLVTNLLGFMGITAFILYVYPESTVNLISANTILSIFAVSTNTGRKYLVSPEFLNYLVTPVSWVI